MADKLNFSLVSPERELYSGEVDQVDIPGTEGDLGTHPNRLRFPECRLGRLRQNKARALERRERS